ncbi:MAG: radical SAM protein [Clostridia bacterium]|nr:radical SAM protein [Clostridia bacterium]
MKCELCPRMCGVNREDVVGFCRANNRVKIARAALHAWEEPCISGEKGSGTVFFSGCTLKCVFCQNYALSHENSGKEISVERLAEIFLELQGRGAHNINLVTPTHYVLQIIEALKIAKKKGLSIPVVYNSSGYERVETIDLLKGYVNIYLPDFKYFSNELAKNYSGASQYFEIASAALKRMYQQVGKPEFDENGMLKKGIVVRHLVLPGFTEDSKRVIRYLYETYGNNIYLSIMNQYTPLPHVAKYPEINRKVTEEEYNAVVDFACDLGVENAFIQEGDTAEESFIPDFESFDF